MERTAGVTHSRWNVTRNVHPSFQVNAKLGLSDGIKDTGNDPID